MAQVRTALDHLLDARTALADEAQRLAAMLAELDSLISTMGGQERLADAGAGSKTPSNPVKASISPGRTATRSAARKSISGRGPANKPATRSPGTGEAPKSIRVHVL